MEYKKIDNPDWDVFVHQFRIISNLDKKGDPTPEGIHKDGHDFISMHMIDRYNVSGGLSEIYNLNKNKVKELCLKNPLDSILLDDTKFYHSVTPIESIDLFEGHRDIMVIDYII